MDLLELSAVTAVDAMRKGDIRAEGYARALLDRSVELSCLNAFRTLNPDMVLEAARAADKARASGKPLGALHGLPIPVKDSVNTRTLPTSNGTRALRDFIPKEDAAVLKPLLAQGALIMGKTNLHELSWGWTSNNATFGPVRNPYDQARIPGGSSGGSAAAVAARMAPLAIGEDTLGSIRIPASCCGLAGLRPTLGRYPDDGIMPITLNKFDQVGPLARSVADLALFDAVVTGETGAIPALSLEGARIGIAPDHFQSGLDAEVERLSNEALRKLRAVGATIVEADIPEIVKTASDIDFAIILYETLPSFAQFLREQETGLTFDEMFAGMSESLQDAMRLLAIAPNRPARESYEAMLLKREQLKDAVRRHFQDQAIDVLAFPTIMCPPPKIGHDVEVEIGDENVPLSIALVRNIALGVCADLASLVLPAGLTSDGLPAGFEFDALPGQDRKLLALGLSLETALGPMPAPIAARHGPDHG